MHNYGIVCLKNYMSVNLIQLYTWLIFNSECFQRRNCESFCCPPEDPSQLTDSNGFPRTECCTALAGRSGCCSAQELQTAVCIDGRVCPDDSGLDNVGNIRNQCCLYFQNGCCSRGENQNLQFL